MDSVFFSGLLDTFDLTLLDWCIAMFSAMMVGIAKTGIGGAGTIAIPLFATIFGGRLSVGFLLPILCFGDIIGVAYYHRHADWHHLRRLLPWALIGILLGAFIGMLISDRLFKALIAFTVLGGIILTIWRERKIDELEVPKSRLFSTTIGLTGGFTSMIGNAAGPVMSLYLLSMKIPKYTFIGTWAWFFLIVNFSKVPFHIFAWKTIHIQSLLFDLAMIPAILIGAVIGVFVVKKIPEKYYRMLILVSTAVAALKLLF